MSEDFKFWITLLGPIIAFIITHVVAYNKMKWEIKDVQNDINGVGFKAREIEKKADSYHMEIVQRVSKIEGILQVRNEKN